jgi:hypothetical protein
MPTTSRNFSVNSSVSFLSASLKLFFDEMRVELLQLKRDVPDFDAICAKKHAYFAANQKWFAAIEIDFEESGADLGGPVLVFLSPLPVQ